jgi:Na+/H+ antiporter NhaD/arsenite permease-like protein
MKRLFALTILALILGAGSAFAQSTIPSTSKPPSIRQSIAAAVRNTTLARTTATPVRAAAGKSFWHTPWPYVIFGAAAVVVIVAGNKGGTSGGGY